MPAGPECRVAFSEECMIKFSIVYEGQETETTRNLEITTGLLCYPSGTAPCPILMQDKCDKEERKGQTWPGFSDNAAKQEI